jgi:hypothetical protein
LPVAFGAPKDEISQGDLLADVPSALIEDLRYMVQTGEDTFKLDSDPQPRRLDRMYPSNAREVRTFGVVITHDCEIDKPSRRSLVYVALVRPLAGVAEEHREGFRSNTRHRAFYLPANEYLPDESYVDLRRMTPVVGNVIGELPRLACMNEDGRSMLREQLFRFFTRRFLPEEWADWPEEINNEA